MEHLSEQESEPEFTQVGEQLSTELVEPGLSEEQMNSSSGDVLIQDWDIGKLIHSNVKLNNLNRVGGSQVYGILTCEPPMAASVYTRTSQSESGSFCQIQPSWAKQFTWLHYSNGAFVGHVQFLLPVQSEDRQFVTQPFKMWINSLEKLREHATLEYHMIAITKCKSSTLRTRIHQDLWTQHSTKKYKGGYMIIKLLLSFF